MPPYTQWGTFLLELQRLSFVVVVVVGSGGDGGFWFGFIYLFI